MCCRGDHDGFQVINSSDRARRDARIQQVPGQRIVAQKVAQQVGGDAAVGDRRDRPRCAGQVSQECPQPYPGLL